MAVSSIRRSSLPRNGLLAALSPGDLTLLQPHLQPMALPVKRDIERPNRRIELSIFMEAGIASVVAVQSDETQVEVGLIGLRGDDRHSRGAGQRPIATFHLRPGCRRRATDGGR